MLLFLDRSTADICSKCPSPALILSCLGHMVVNGYRCLLGSQKISNKICDVIVLCRLAETIFIPLTYLFGASRKAASVPLDEKTPQSTVALEYLCPLRMLGVRSFMVIRCRPGLFFSLSGKWHVSRFLKTLWLIATSPATALPTTPKSIPSKVKSTILPNTLVNFFASYKTERA